MDEIAYVFRKDGGKMAEWIELRASEAVDSGLISSQVKSTSQ